MTLYYYRNEWHVATQGKPDAAGKMSVNKQDENRNKVRFTDEEYANIPTFAKIFWQIWNKKGYKLPSEEDQKFCFMFELTVTSVLVCLRFEQ